MKRIILIILIIFLSCGEKQEKKVDNCTFVKRLEIFNLIDIEISHFSLYPKLCILFGLSDYLTCYLEEIPLETYKIGKNDDNIIWRWEIALTPNFIYVFTTVGGITPGICETGWGNVRIEKYSSDGVLLDRWNCIDMGLNYNYDVEITFETDADDNFYLLLNRNGEYLISKINSEGNLIFTRSTGESSKDNNGALGIDEHNKLLYLLTKTKRIKKFTLDGNLLEIWELPDFSGEFYVPVEITLLHNGEIFVLGTGDEGKGIILEFNTIGELIGKWSSCRDLVNNVKQIISFDGILAVKEAGEKHFKAYIDEDVYLLRQDN